MFLAFLLSAVLLVGGASYDQYATEEALAGDWDAYVGAMTDGKSRICGDNGCPAVEEYEFETAE